MLKQAQPRGIQIFSAKPTCLIANAQSVIMASEDKCLRIVPLNLIDSCETLPLNPMAVRRSNKGNKTENKRQKQGQSDPNDKPLNQTLFSIIRSRVFYQQKTVDSQRIVQEMTDQSILATTNISEIAIDHKLLLFHHEPATARNYDEALAVIQSELQTCLFVERFEFFQKLIVLNVWLFTANSQTIEAVKDLIAMHAPNIKDDGGSQFTEFRS